MRQRPDVPDHAVLRYLEREHGVPVEAVRTLLAIMASGSKPNDTFVCGRRVKIVLDNGMVVTCLKRHWTRREEMRERKR